MPFSHFLVLFLELFSLQVDSVTQFSVKNNQLVDDYGRECFFHGVNVVYKSPPWLPILDEFDYELSFSDEDMKLLNSLGQNIIRLGVMWPGVNPELGYYNLSYVSKARNLIQTAWEDYGIHTLVDCHQDVIGAQTCGEGAPGWAMQPKNWNFPFPIAEPYDTDDNHVPSRDDCLSHSWASYYASAAASSIFQRIYQNYNGLADAFADYWGVLANEFKNTDGIVGFELMNEPWAGDIYEDILLMYPGVADRKNLQPFYDRIAPVIYNNDSNRMIFFESVTWTDEFNISLTETGFDHVPGGEQYSDQSIFSFHYYSTPNIGSEDKYFSARTDDAKNKWNCGSMLTEFDISNDGETMNQFDKMSTTMSLCDKYKVGWIGWEYKPLAGDLPTGTCTGCGNGLFLNNGTLNVMVAKALSRTYPQRVSGSTQDISFDYTTGDFQLSFIPDTNIEQPSIIYTNLDYWYTNGYNLAITPNNNDITTNTSANGDLLYINTYNTNINGAITVQISAK